MQIKNVIKYVIQPGLELLPAKMNTPRAIAMLIAIGLQESRFIHRKQIGGPARSFYQAEKGGGVAQALQYYSCKPYIEPILELLEINKAEVYDAIVYNDVLATVVARLILWSDAKALPLLTASADESWDCYIRNWKPGKPHRHSWDAFWKTAVNAVHDLEHQSS